MPRARPARERSGAELLVSGSGKPVSEAVAARDARSLIRRMPAHSTIRHLFARHRVFRGAPLCSALCGALSLGVATVARAQTPDAAPLLAADRALSARAGDGIAALASSGTADVVFLYPGAPVARGRDTMARLLDSVAETTHDRLTWSPARIEISTDGRRGYAYGRGTRTTLIDGRDSASGIRYVTWWQRDGAGAWHPAAWLLIDERQDPAHTDGEREQATSASWRCRTPTTSRFASHTISPTLSRVSSSTPRAAIADATAAVIAADSVFAARSAIVGAAVAFAEYVADDGISLGAAGAPACGRREVGAQLDGVAPSALEWSPIIGDASGDLGYTVGTATIRGEHGVHYSKYLTVWKRQPDGAWRFVVDGGNPAPARVATFTAQR